jgi:uncharacterized membrane protein YbaN (DUF454 family)
MRVSILINVPAMKRILLEISGWAFVALGIAGLFLPFLQGILFLLVGLTILSMNHHWARRWIARLLERFPNARSALKKFLGKYSRYVPGLAAQAATEKETA